MLLGLGGRGARSPALVGLRAFEGRQQSIGDGRDRVRRPGWGQHGSRASGGSGSGEAVEGNTEAELQGHTLAGKGLGSAAGGPEVAVRCREHRGGHVERSHLGVSALAGQSHRLLHHGLRLRREGLRHRAAASEPSSCPHLQGYRLSSDEEDDVFS